MSSKPIFLDVDSSILENNLKITDDPAEEQFNSILNVPGEQYPSKLIKPLPGFCVKTKEIGTDIKIFVNICRTDSIPPPKDITETELFNILNTDEITEYRVPMSIGDLRNESDNKGSQVKVCDVAINNEYFETVEKSDIFKKFLLAVVFEALSQKHSTFTTDDRILMKNRKAFGTLQVHRIQQREINEKMGKGNETSILQNVEGYGNTTQRPKIEILSDNTANKVPEYRLFKKYDDPNILYVEARLPNVISSKELTLDVGEDRIILECTLKNYLLDIFVPFNVLQEKSTSTFNKDTKILTITMPIQVKYKI